MILQLAIVEATSEYFGNFNCFGEALKFSFWLLWPSHEINTAI